MTFAILVLRHHCNYKTMTNPGFESDNRPLYGAKGSLEDVYNRKLAERARLLVSQLKLEQEANNPPAPWLSPRAILNAALHLVESEN